VIKGLINLDKLKTAANEDQIDTVLVCLVDMQGRLMGKRFHVSNFIESAHDETHCCDYLLATDLEMATPDGYVASSWAAGYGDYIMKPDLSTLRILPWLEGTAMVLCDILDHHTHQAVPHSPRAVLKRQIERLQSLGYAAMFCRRPKRNPSCAACATHSTMRAFLWRTLKVKPVLVRKN